MNCSESLNYDVLCSGTAALKDTWHESVWLTGDTKTLAVILEFPWEH